MKESESKKTVSSTFLTENETKKNKKVDANKGDKSDQESDEDVEEDEEEDKEESTPVTKPTA